MPPTEKIELLPCPFCGGKGKVGYVEAFSCDSSYNVIQCEECPAQMVIDRFPPTADDIAAWNLRTAALAVEAGAVGVKPLEWNEDGNVPEANSPVGTYVVYPHYCHVELVVGAGSFVSISLRRIELDKGATVADLKAAAQADYEARIRSALTTSPASSAVEGEAVATEPHNIYPISADPNIYTASSYANRSIGGFAHTPAGDTDLTRPIIGIENRTAQEVFDIMVDRIRFAGPAPQPEEDK